jgi:hypothetical protein
MTNLNVALADPQVKAGLLTSAAWRFQVRPPTSMTSVQTSSL